MNLSGKTGTKVLVNKFKVSGSRFHKPHFTFYKSQFTINEYYTGFFTLQQTNHSSRNR